MASYVRQTGDQNQANSPRPVPEQKLAELRALLQKRIDIVDQEEAEAFEKKFTQRLSQWRSWQRTEWETKRVDGDVGLLTRAGSYLSAEDWEFTWATPQSMRNVDAECSTEITREYLTSEEILSGEGLLMRASWSNDSDADRRHLRSRAHPGLSLESVGSPIDRARVHGPT